MPRNIENITAPLRNKGRIAATLVRTTRKKSRLTTLVTEARALNQQYRFAEADQLVADAIAQHPDNMDLSVQFTRLAEDRGDFYEAARRAETMRQGFPDKAFGYRAGIRILLEIGLVEDAARIYAEVGERFAGQSWLRVAAARVAMYRHAWDEAERLWKQAQEDFPDEPQMWLGTASFFAFAGRFEAAETTMRDALARFPDNLPVLVRYAEIAENLKNFPEADRRWLAARESFPDNDALWLGYALVPSRAKQWDEALARLREVEARFPGHIKAIASQIRVLRRSGRLAEASAFAADVTGAMPQAVELALEFALVKEAQSGLGQAINYLITLYGKYPLAGSVYLLLADALVRADRTSEAEAVCARAMARFPYSAEFYIVYANAAMRRQNWPEAVNRWRVAARWAPAHPRVRFSLATAEQFLDPEAGVAAATAVASASSSSPLRDLMMTFESMGGVLGGFGCEFGFIQRRFGAEPVGLLRWAEMPTGRLIEALNCRFEGLGLPDQAELILAGEQAEYTVKDRRFELITHTFAKRGDLSPELIIENTCRHLGFFRRKFIEDLEQASKIFVVYRPYPVPGFEEIEQVRRAMAQYGDNTLLLVCPSDAGHRAGSVEYVQPNLMVGYLRETDATIRRGPGALDYAGWSQLCLEAYRVFQSAGG